jgi:predicted O-linked N-acetylglucosamine transferase (SPINDLY family)
MMSLAVQHHRAGNLADAEQLYLQVLKTNPNHTDALHLLGEIAHRYGRHEIAIDYITRALAIHPYAAVYHFTLAMVYEFMRKYGDAADSLVRAVELKTDFPEAYNNLGACRKAQGRLDEAIACYRRAIELRPEYAFARNNLGASLAAQGRLDEAIACYREALRLKPDYDDAYSNLGNALAGQERWDEASASFQEALRLRPDGAATYNNFGTVLAAQGKLDEAIAVYRRALSLHPQLAAAHNNLGSALQELGHTTAAATAFREALRFDPGCVDAHLNLASILQEERQFDDATAQVRTALGIEPKNAKAYNTLGTVLANQGKLEEARASYQQALAFQPSDRLRIVLATMLPLVYESMDHLWAERRGFSENLCRLREEGVSLDLTRQLAPTSFYLAYQGQNDRDLRQEFASLCHPPGAEPAFSGGGLAFDRRENLAAAHHSLGRKVRVGFISAHFREHTVGRLTQSLVANLSRDRLSVTVLSAATRPDTLTDVFRQHADQFITVPANLQAARRLISDLALDVLFYVDIGMHAFTDTLAFSRLAPIQCVTWGHPDTTGLSTIDYFISSDLFETEDADRHYTEKLVRLRSFPPYSDRPEAKNDLGALTQPRSQDREHFGFADDCHLYACLQSLFKLHPEFDTVLGGILRRDPKGVVILSIGNHPHWHDALRRRFAASMADVLDRIRFVGWLSSEDYLRLNAASDVVLDPMHFGGGRSSYEFFGLGLPVVTLPSQFLRGRLTLGMYRKMRLRECVARTTGEYIDIAVKLGTEPEYRAAIRSKILAANDVLYVDPEAIRELECFFEHAVAQVC